MGGTHVLGDGAFRHVKPANRFGVVEAKDGVWTSLKVPTGWGGLGLVETFCSETFCLIVRGGTYLEKSSAIMSYELESRIKRN
jgi:hypothetical protein